jgi:hypothetical protein
MKTSLLDRLGDDGPVLLVAGGWGLFAAVFLGLGALLHSLGSGLGIVRGVLVALALAALVWITIVLGTLLVTRLAAGGLVSALLTGGGRAGGEREYSEIQSLIARGRKGEARGALHRLVRAAPQELRPRAMLAELLQQENPSGAARLYEEIRAHPAAPPAQRLQALLRLADLYEGPLQRPEKARDSLREVEESFPGTRAAAGARAALAREPSEQEARGSG